MPLVAAVSLLLGIVLLTIGVRRRRAARSTPTWSYGPADEIAEPAAPSWTPTPETEGPEAPASPEAASPVGAPPGVPAVEPAARRGTAFISAGAGLLLIGLVAGGSRLADNAAAQREVALPSSVLGLARDAEATAEADNQLEGDALPPGLKDPQTAVYGMLPRAVLVLAARGNTTRPRDDIEAFRRAFEKDGGMLTQGTDVDAGPLGGAARCWAAKDLAPDAVVCVFADRGSLVATTDFLGGGLQAAAERGLQIRTQTVRRP